MATITKRGEGWFIQIRRKGYSARYRTFRTKAEGLAWAREEESRIDRDAAPKDLRSLRAMSLGDVLRRYLSDVTPQKRSADSEASRLGKILRAPLCDLLLAELTPAALASYRDERLRLAKPGTVRRELSLLRHALEVARREWGVPLVTNPVEAVARPVANDARDRRLRPGDLERLQRALAETRNPLLRPAILLLLETGLRRGELLGLRWEHINLCERTARIPLTKTDKPRTIPLTDAALGILRDLRPEKDGRAFSITPVALRHAWDRLRQRAGLPDLHLHDLRHEAISRFSEMGLNTAELALISGHRDVRMLARYTHHRPADLARKLTGRSWAEEVGRAA